MSTTTPPVPNVDPASSPAPATPASEVVAESTTDSSAVAGDGAVAEGATPAEPASAAATAEAVTAVDAQPKTVGALLKAAREADGLSVGDVAMRLRMSVKQVVALEAGDYAVLPTGTFLRGFVRSYAKQVRVDPALAIAVLEASTRDAAALAATAIVAPSHNIELARGEKAIATQRARLVIAAVALLVGALIVFYWWNYVKPYRGDGGRPHAAEKSAAAPMPATAPAVAEGQAAADSAAGSVTQPTVVSDSSANTAAAGTPTVTSTPGAITQPLPAPVTTSAATSVQPSVAKAPPQATTPVTTSGPSQGVPSSRTAASATGAAVPQSPARSGAGEGVLGFTFSGESWVEVMDGSGRTVLSRRFTRGEVGEVSGRPPLSIVIGNAPNTRMAYNGQEFDLTPHTRVAVARVTLK